MKAYTDIEQSRKLAEILPLESVDMYFHNRSDIPDNYSLPIEWKHNNPLLSQEIPCWSLAALLGVLPQSITQYIENERCQKTFHLNLFRSYNCCVSYDEIPSVNDDNSLYCIGRDNWVDACYEMILKLHELKKI